jgi:GTP cyclohydrolase IA
VRRSPPFAVPLTSRSAQCLKVVHRARKRRRVEAIRGFDTTTGRRLSRSSRLADCAERCLDGPRFHAIIGASHLPDAAMQVDTARIEKLTRELIEALGEDPTREGLLKTPERVAKAIAFLTSGYRTDLPAIINNAIFTQTTNSMVIVKNIEVYSLCEHHMLPFFGRCHIGYIPTGRVFGVSKLARLVDMYARRLQLQERLTEQISQAVHDSIDARGVGVMIEARHLCMMMRGVEKQNSEMVTSSVLGTFRESQATREEFLALIGSRA